MKAFLVVSCLLAAATAAAVVVDAVPLIGEGGSATKTVMHTQQQAAEAAPCLAPPAGLARAQCEGDVTAFYSKSQGSTSARNSAVDFCAKPNAGGACMTDLYAYYSKTLGWSSATQAASVFCTGHCAYKERLDCLNDATAWYGGIYGSTATREAANTMCMNVDDSVPGAGHRKMACIETAGKFYRKYYGSTSANTAGEAFCKQAVVAPAGANCLADAAVFYLKYLGQRDMLSNVQKVCSEPYFQADCLAKANDILFGRTNAGSNYNRCQRVTETCIAEAQQAAANAPASSSSSASSSMNGASSGSSSSSGWGNGGRPPLCQAPTGLDLAACQKDALTAFDRGLTPSAARSAADAYCAKPNAGAQCVSDTYAFVYTLQTSTQSASFAGDFCANDCQYTQRLDCLKAAYSFFYQQFTSAVSLQSAKALCAGAAADSGVTLTCAKTAQAFFVRQWGISSKTSYDRAVGYCAPDAEARAGDRTRNADCLAAAYSFYYTLLDSRAALEQTEEFCDEPYADITCLDKAKQLHTNGWSKERSEKITKTCVEEAGKAEAAANQGRRHRPGRWGDDNNDDTSNGSSSSSSSDGDGRPRPPPLPALCSAPAGLSLAQCTAEANTVYNKQLFSTSRSKTAADAFCARKNAGAQCLTAAYDWRKKTTLSSQQASDWATAFCTADTNYCLYLERLTCLTNAYDMYNRYFGVSQVRDKAEAYCQAAAPVRTGEGQQAVTCLRDAFSFFNNKPGVFQKEAMDRSAAFCAAPNGAGRDVTCLTTAYGFYVRWSLPAKSSLQYAEKACATPGFDAACLDKANAFIKQWTKSTDRCDQVTATCMAEAAKNAPPAAGNNGN